MPWHVGKAASCPASRPYALIKDSDGSIVACHATKTGAMKQMAALYAKEASTGVSMNDSRPPRDNIVRAMLPGPVFRAAEDGSSPHLGILNGHFAVFNQWTKIDSMFEGTFMERLAPGSFRKTFKENIDAIRVLFQHGRDPQVGDKPLGPIQRLEEDEEGAAYDVPLLDTSYNRDLKPGLEAGLYGASFRFQVMKEDFDQAPKKSAWNPDGLPERTIREARVHEFGPVTFPAYAAATAGMRSLTDLYVFDRFTRDPDQLAALVEAMRSNGTLPEAGAGADHSVPESRPWTVTTSDTVTLGNTSFVVPELIVPSTVRTAPPAPKPKENPPVEVPTSDPLDEFRTVPEMQAALLDRKNQLQVLDTEYEGRELPAAAKSDWDRIDAEVERLNARIKATEERRIRLERLAANGGTQEPEYTAPNVIRQTADIYDLADVRRRSNSELEERQLLRDNAMRSVEAAHFPHPGADRDKVRSDLADLLNKGVEQDTYGRVQYDAREVARRILTTGNPVYRRAFGKYLATGTVGPEIERALSLGTTGIPIPYTLDPTLIHTSNGSVNPFRSICRVIPITVDEWRGATSGAITAAYAAEVTEAGDNTPTLTQPTISTEKAQAFIPFSIEAGGDWPSLESEMAALLQESKDDLEATKFTLGTGTNEPFGLIVGATTVVTGGGGAGTFVIGDLYKTEEALPPRYRPRAQWMANRFIYNKARQFDTSGGAGLWMYLPAGLGNTAGGNTGAQLLGYAANENSAMDAVLTTGSEIAVLGDFSRFVIVDRVGLNIELIPHMFATANNRPSGQRGLYAYWRNGSKVVDVNAFRTLQTA